VCVCVGGGHLQQCCYVETIRTVRRKTPIKNRTPGPQKTARQKLLRFEKEATAGRASSSPGSEQSNFESRQRAEQVRVQAADRIGSSQGTGRLAENKRRQRGPVHSVSST